MCTFSLTASASMPSSTKNSSALGGFLSSSVATCGGLRAGCSAPRRVSPSDVVTRTRWETMFAGSWPPSVCSRRKPLSSTYFTRKPISSVWAATITRASPLPRFVPITLPSASVLTSSVRVPSSSRATSRCFSSRPGTPGVSIRRFKSLSLIAMLLPSQDPVDPMSVPAAPETVKGESRYERRLCPYTLLPKLHEGAAAAPASRLGRGLHGSPWQEGDAGGGPDLGGGDELLAVVGLE